MQTIVTIGIFQAIMAVLFFIVTKRKRQGEFLLVTTFVVCMLHLLAKTLLLHLFGFMNKGFELSTFFQTTYSLLYYLYARKLSNAPLWPKTDLCVFVAILSLSAVNYGVVVYEGLNHRSVGRLLVYNYINNWLFVVVNTWFAVRTYLQTKQIARFWKEEIAMLQQFSLLGLLTLVYFAGTLLLHSFPFDGMGILSSFSRYRWVNYSILLYMALAIVWYKLKISEVAWPENQLPPKTINQYAPARNNAITVLQNTPVPVLGETQKLAVDVLTESQLQPAPPDETIKESTLQEIVGSLEKLITEKHLYKDTELTIEKLSLASGIYKHHISTAINQFAGKPFQLFINEFRVKKVMEDLEKCRQKNVTPNMLMIAFEAGFNSKSSFNLNFKKLTGHSPTGYLRENSLSAVHQTEEKVLA